MALHNHFPLLKICPMSPTCTSLCWNGGEFYLLGNYFGLTKLVCRIRFDIHLVKNVQEKQCCRLVCISKILDYFQKSTFARKLRTLFSRLESSEIDGLMESSLFFSEILENCCFSPLELIRFRCDGVHSAFLLMESNNY